MSALDLMEKDKDSRHAYLMFLCFLWVVMKSSGVLVVWTLMDVTALLELELFKFWASFHCTDDKKGLIETI